MAAISIFFRLLLLISFVPALVPQDTIFDVELVHRDSPKSPLFNSSMTPFDRLQAAVVRSVNRASYLDNRIDMKTSINIELGLRYDDGEFLMRFRMGTPNSQSMWGASLTLICQYHATYGDGSNIDGIFSSETFSFTSLGTNQNTFIPNMVFGCNFRSLHIQIDDPGSFIGLGPRSPSLIH
ncbi:probable aspartic protease At2g35615 [Zingiber officinale]|uniref:probable aspartic protease At2g35615 n=1 Tax=Zingiber officinale TaxID=94328 RepID=UPI001C4CAFD4|nr:probable aspartic protease At2g35615 [Zingiber officinale]XP_042450832.1 probable aspartic protease At2g35615 [Zingiber officinale]